MKGKGKKCGFVLSLLVVAVMVLTVGAAGAATITWSFANPTGDLGTTETYSSGGYNIVAAAFGDVGYHSYTSTGNFTLPGNVSPGTLYGNGDSLGVAITSGSSNTIGLGEIIQIDLQELISAGFTNETATVLRLTGTNATAQVFGSNISADDGVTGTYLASFSGSGDHIFSLGDPGAYRYQWFYVTPNAGTVTLASITADLAGDPPSVPEPSTLLLLGSGLLGLVGYGRRRMKR